MAKNNLSKGLKQLAIVTAAVLTLSGCSIFGYSESEKAYLAKVDSNIGSVVEGNLSELSESGKLEIGHKACEAMSEGASIPQLIKAVPYSDTNEYLATVSLTLSAAYALCPEYSYKIQEYLDWEDEKKAAAEADFLEMARSLSYAMPYINVIDDIDEQEVIDAGWKVCQEWFPKGITMEDILSSGEKPYWVEFEASVAAAASYMLCPEYSYIGKSLVE
jgi:hypothetical protein